MLDSWAKFRVFRASSFPGLQVPFLGSAKAETLKRERQFHHNDSTEVSPAARIRF